MWKLKALCTTSPQSGQRVAVHSFRLWKLKENTLFLKLEFEDEVAVHSFRLWKLKGINACARAVSCCCCSSLVPIVETESPVLFRRRGDEESCSSLVPIVETESISRQGANQMKQTVAVHSFRLWKLKARWKSLMRCARKCCSSLVPIVETERSRDDAWYEAQKRVAVHSFRLWKLKGVSFLRTDGLYQVAVHSFRLWKLKAQVFKELGYTLAVVAVHSFRLWKLKAFT